MTTIYYYCILIFHLPQYGHLIPIAIGVSILLIPIEPTLFDLQISPFHNSSAFSNNFYTLQELHKPIHTRK